MTRRTYNMKPLNMKPIIHTKRNITRKREYNGGNNNTKKDSVIRDNFRKMFTKYLNKMIATENVNKDMFFRHVSEFVSSLKNHSLGINTLVPVSKNKLPIDKYTYDSSITPIVDFIPWLSVIFYNIKDNESKKRLIKAFVKNKGNINLESIKSHKNILSVAKELNDKEIEYFLNKKKKEINKENRLFEKDYVKSPELDQLPENNEKEEEIEIKNKTKRKRKRELHIQSFKMPPKGDVFTQLQSDEDDADLALKISNGVTQVTDINNILEPNYKISKPNIIELTIPFELPMNGYNINEPPVFWNSLFNNELINIRNKLTSMINNDVNNTGDMSSVCKIIKSMMPNYYIAIKNEPTVINVGQDQMYIYELAADFLNLNIILCATTLIVGIITEKMREQNYNIIIKGGRAVQLVLSSYQIVDPLISEDIDILVVPKDGVQYDRENIRNLSSHIGYLIKWFLNSPDLQERIIDKISVSLENRNPDIVKLSYVKMNMKYNHKKKIMEKDYKQFSDIDFKQIPDNIKIYFQDLSRYPYIIDELNTNVLFVTPSLESIINEKLYYYIKFTIYEDYLTRGKPITDIGYDTLTVDECKYFLKKFKKSIMAISKGFVNNKYIGIEIEDGFTKTYIYDHLKPLIENKKIREKIMINLFE